MHRVVVLTALFGCYSPTYTSCHIQCTDSCPNGLECDSDLHLCRPAGTSCGGVTGDDGGGPPGSPMCTRVVYDQMSDNHMDLNVTLNPTIAAGNFVVVALSENAPANATVVQVADLNTEAPFTKAVSRDVMAGSFVSSQLYYMDSAPVDIQTVQIRWSMPIVEIASISAWHCSGKPELLTAGSNASTSAGSATDTGAVTLGQSALVVAALATSTGPLPHLEGSDFNAIDPESGSFGSGAPATFAGAWGEVGSGSVDISFTTDPGSEVAGTTAAFGIPML